MGNQVNLSIGFVNLIMTLCNSYGHFAPIVVFHLFKLTTGLGCNLQCSIFERLLIVSIQPVKYDISYVLLLSFELFESLLYYVNFGLIDKKDSSRGLRGNSYMDVLTAEHFRVEMANIFPKKSKV